MRRQDVTTAGQDEMTGCEHSQEAEGTGCVDSWEDETTRCNDSLDDERTGCDHREPITKLKMEVF